MSTEKKKKFIIDVTYLALILVLSYLLLQYALPLLLPFVLAFLIAYVPLPLPGAPRAQGVGGGTAGGPHIRHHRPAAGAGGNPDHGHHHVSGTADSLALFRLYSPGAH